MLKNSQLLANDYNTTSSELFKSTFLEHNQNWTHQQQQNTPLSDSFPSPSSYEYPFNIHSNNEEENNDNVSMISSKQNSNNRVHLRHFSANDSHCMGKVASSYLTSPSSSPFLLQQHQITNNNLLNSNYNNTATNELEISKPKQQQRRLRFDIVLEAATAVTQKAEESAITYLNRGQVYGIQLNDKQAANEMITSTLSIAFHSSSHRRIAESYWKFWISQQKQPNARAIDIDASQSTGISDLKFPSFDKITFNWNGSYGSKIFVRFKCLSTDFSRIKGVKGIPLRTQMDSMVAAKSEEEEAEEPEVCFCKVKLFRDKGAERKNKDDAKQISKQLEKVYGKATEQSLPLMYNVSLPYSVFGEIPTSSTLDSFEHATEDDLLSNLQQQQQQIKTPARHHTRVMTAPTSLFYSNNNKRSAAKGRKSISSIHPPYQHTTTKSSSPPSGAVVTSSSLSNTPLISTKENYDFQKYLTQQQQALASLPSIDTHNLDNHTPLLLNHHHHHNTNNTTLTFDDDLPPLTADALPTPGTAQPTPTEFTHHHQDVLFDDNSKKLLFLTSDFYNTPQPQNTSPPILSSIYDIFTPEEIQQPPEECSITPTREDFFGTTTTTTANHSSPQYQQQYIQRDYFCSMEPATNNSFTLLQQQLQLHNQTASSIMLNNNSSNMLLLSPPIQDGGNKRKKRRSTVLNRQQQQKDDNKEEDEDSRILTYSSNPSHLTVSSGSDCSSIKSESVSSSSNNNQQKKLRYNN